MAARTDARRETIQQFKVFYDFQFTDRLKDSGITFVHWHRTEHTIPLLPDNRRRIGSPRQGGLTESRKADAIKILEVPSVLGTLAKINDSSAREQLS